MQPKNPLNIFQLVGEPKTDVQQMRKTGNGRGYKGWGGDAYTSLNLCYEQIKLYYVHKLKTSSNACKMPLKKTTFEVFHLQF